MRVFEEEEWLVVSPWRYSLVALLVGLYPAVGVNFPGRDLAVAAHVVGPALGCAKTPTDAGGDSSVQVGKRRGM